MCELTINFIKLRRDILLMWAIIETIEWQVNNVAGAIVILLVGLILGLMIKKILKKVLEEIGVDKLASKFGKKYYLERKISNVIGYVVYFLVVLMALRQLGITSLVLYLVLGSVSLLIGATLVLMLRDLIPNLIGRRVVKKKGYVVGKELKLDLIKGKIEKLGWSETIIKTAKGDKLHIPNLLLRKKLTS